MTLYDELIWRGLIKDESSLELKEKLNNGGLTFYIGTDPTGPSLHIGHYLSFSMSRRLEAHGHKPILLVGGATGLIGDPRPNADERPMITKEQLEYNYKKLRTQVEKIFGFEVVNNYDWSKNIDMIDYLRDYGKYFPINYMLAKETVKSRLEIGITYTEFSYMIMQALDFVWLYENKGVTLQMGGQDQWGNITAGIELARKKIGADLYGFTMPLVTKADGSKFGKSVSGKGIWLDKEMTSSYELYQFFLNAEDSMIIDYLKTLSFYSVEEIKDLAQKHVENPHLREAHKALAKDVIIYLHGEKEYEKAVKISEALFSEEIFKLEAKDVMEIFKDIPNFTIETDKDYLLIDLLVANSICASKREAREMMDAGAILINNVKYKEYETIITRDNAIENKILIIKKGKKNYFMGIFK